VAKMMMIEQKQAKPAGFHGVLVWAAILLSVPAMMFPAICAAGSTREAEQNSSDVIIGEIANPSYEDPADFLTGWSSCLAGESSIKHNPTTGQPDPRFHDGDHSAGMSSDRPGDRLGAGAIFQEVHVTPGRTYRVRCWGTLTDNTGYLDDFLELRIRDGDSTPINCDDNGAAIEDNSKPHAHLDDQPQPQWTLLEGEIIPTEEIVTVIAYWKFSGTAWGIKSLHLDDWSIEDVTPSIVYFSNFQSSRVINGDTYDVTLSYDTAISVTTQIDWGPTPGYGHSSPLDPAEVVQHVVDLTGVTPAANRYHYRAHATASGEIDEYSIDQTFFAPWVTFSGIDAAVDLFSGVVCTISWETNFATSANSVFYRESGAGSYIEVIDPSDPTSQMLHTVILVGLSLDTAYEYYVRSGGDGIIASTSIIQSFSTPAQPRPPIQIGMAMIGGSIPDGGDDVGPANEVQDMIERDHPMVTFSGMTRTSWGQAQPDDPGEGPNVYDWSTLDARAQTMIPGKALRAYQQIWGSYPDWVELDTPRFWEKYEAFVEAMTVYINQNYGTVYYVFENEPNISRAPDGWNWADWYIHCLQHFHAAVHAAHSATGHDNKVIAGNLCGHSAGGFNELYARGLKDCSDILGYHPYPYDIRDGLDVDDLAQIHAIQMDYDDADKRIFVSEGWGSGRSAGFDRSSPLIDPPAQEVENMYLAMVNGWDNVMTPRENWHPDYLWGMSFFCGNDNWGAMNHRARAIPDFDDDGNIVAFWLDGYHKGIDIAPYFWNGGMMDFYGNSKDCLIHVFPGNGLVFMNPGFELASDPPNEHLPQFWMPNTDPALMDNYSLDNHIFHGGGRSLRLTQIAADNHGVSQMTARRSVIPGVSYRTRLWCRTEDDDGLAARFYMCFCDLDGSVKSSRTWATDVTGSADWQQLEIVATAPAFASRVEMGCEIEGVGTAWFDDVTVAMTSQEETGTVRGYTLDEGQIPVPGCVVGTTTGGFQAVSDTEGYYEIQRVSTGTYDFVCRKAGYTPHRVGNQTVVAGKQTFVSFNMGIPKPGLTVTQVTCDPDHVPPSQPATVSITVANDKPYPNIVDAVDLFVEQDGVDVTEMFVVRASSANPEVIPADDESAFAFALTPRPQALDQNFEVNAYAVGQEDRPNMLDNSGFDDEPWNNHWSFSGGAQTLAWDTDSADYRSPPRSLRCYVADDDYTWNWASNRSAYWPDAIPARPAQSYTVGVNHKDTLVGGVSVNLFIQEYYYDGSDWFANGRRLASVPHRSVWAHDVMIYETGDPNVTQGLYDANRLIVSCGPCTSPISGAGFNWWDDLYVKETGDRLADDRADVGASFAVTQPQIPVDFDDDGDVDQEDFGYFQVCLSGPDIVQDDPGCFDARLDNDDDVDQDDLAIFQACISGADVPADPGCAD